MKLMKVILRMLCFLAIILNTRLQNLIEFYVFPVLFMIPDFVKKLFTGTLRSILICQKCGCKRTQTESFLSISLPLTKESPTSTDNVTEKGTKSSPRSIMQSVEICLQRFTQPETLADHVHCSSCDTKTKTLKQHTFSKLPKVLCLHLKRFDAATNKKITELVSFPAYGLDMGSHLPHWSEKMQEQGEPHSGTSRDCVESPTVLYDLFGTVNHKGSLNQGHYVANVKSGEQWYNCNDAHISKAGEGNGEKAVLQSDGAYMLFYVHR